MQKEKKIFYFSISLIRAFGCFAVIILHTAAPILAKIEPLSIYWWIGNLTDSLVRFSVPIFVMASGATILSNLNKNEISILSFYKKRLSKIFPALAFWTVIYSAINIYLYDFDSIQVLANFLKWLLFKILIFGKPYYHMWYLYMILGIYILTPFLSRLIKFINPRNQKWLLILGFSITSIIQLTIEYQGTKLPFLINSILYVPYFLAGYYFFEKRNHFRETNIKFLIFYLLSGILICLFTGFLYPNLKNLSWLIMYSYLNPLVILMTINLYIYLLNFKIFKSSLLVDFIVLVSKFSLGIYLVHPLVLILLGSLGIDSILIPNIFGIIFTSVITFFLSFLFCLSLRNINFVKSFIQT